MEHEQKNFICPEQLEIERAELMEAYNISYAKNFFAWEKEFRDMIPMSVSYVGVTGELKSGMLLNQIIKYYYIFQVRRECDTKQFGFFREGSYWIFYDALLDDYQRLLFLKKFQFIKALNILIQKSLISIKMFDGTFCIKLCWSIFLTNLEGVVGIGDIENHISSTISDREKLKSCGELITLLKKRL